MGEARVHAADREEAKQRGRSGADPSDGRDEGRRERDEPPG